VRHDLREKVIAELGDPCWVLVVDETGFLKKGTQSCGAQPVLDTFALSTLARCLNESHNLEQRLDVRAAVVVELDDVFPTVVTDGYLITLQVEADDPGLQVEEPKRAKGLFQLLPDIWTLIGVDAAEILNFPAESLVSCNADFHALLSRSDMLAGVVHLASMANLSAI